jgi:predicted phosphate transport protein (TIGR00153 family)
MRTIAGLFGKSPFGALQAHVAKVNSCVHKIRPLVDALIAGDMERLDNISNEISQLEHEADVIKNDLRDRLPRSLFLPAARSDLLVLLEVLDSVADAVQDVSVLSCIRKLDVPDVFKSDLIKLAEFAQVSSGQLMAIFDHLQDLLESSFRGKPAQDAFESIKNVGRTEHSADEVSHRLMKLLYNIEDQLRVQDFLIWDKLLSTLSKVSDFSRKAANRVRMILAR